MRSEPSGVRAKKLPHAKSHLSASGSILNYFSTDILFTSGLRLLAETVSAAGALWTPMVTFINYKVDSISKYVCSTVIIDINEKSPNFPIYKFLMSNDDVITSDELSFF